MSSVLVLGGAKSGKSRYAEQLAAGERIYIATNELQDEEMQSRIAAHQRQRGAGWMTLEAPLDLAGTLSAQDGPGRFILVDCLTIWIGNMMHHEAAIEGRLQELAALVPQLSAKTVLVSNEVGQGIVPDNRMAREFRDWQGRCNQMMAAACDEVVLVVAGLPLTLKTQASR